MAEQNQLDAMKPELWNKFGLRMFWEELVFGKMVNWEFKDEMASHGQVVNFHKAQKREMQRKGINPLKRKAAKFDNVAIKLDQHLYDAFYLTDLQLSLSFDSLVTEVMYPSIQAMVLGFEKVLAGRAITGLLKNTVGQLGSLTNANAKSRGLLINQHFNNVLAPHPRNTALAPNSETQFLDTDLFLSANTTGDGGLAMREALIGRKLAQNFVRGSAVPTIPAELVATVDREVDHTGGYSIGDTNINCSTAPAQAEGTYVTFEGSMYPYRIESWTDATHFVIKGGLRHEISDTAAIHFVQGGLVNCASDYVQGWEEPIVCDNFTVAPVIGQLIGLGESQYMVMSYDAISGEVMLDRPLDTAITDNSPANLGPAGDYNVSLVKNAIAVVTRPLSRPITPAFESAVQSYNGLSMRTTIGYDMDELQNKVNIDFLLGTKVIEDDMGLVFFG